MKTLPSHDAGFTLPELLVASTLMLIVFGVVTTSLSQLAQAHRRIWNRTERHSGTRCATELLQQEIGHAGRIALPAPVTLTQLVTTGTNTVGVSSTANMFVGEQLIFFGNNQETVKLTAVNKTNNTITGVFFLTHPVGASVIVAGGFERLVEPAAGYADSRIAPGLAAALIFHMALLAAAVVIRFPPAIVAPSDDPIAISIVAPDDLKSTERPPPGVLAAPAKPAAKAAAPTAQKFNPRDIDGPWDSARGMGLDPTTVRGGAPGRPRPAPATTPIPRLMSSCSSSRFDDAVIAESSVTRFCWYSVASD